MLVLIAFCEDTQSYAALFDTLFSIESPHLLNKKSFSKNP